MTGSVRPAFDLVIFDLDGTLVATAGELADAVNDSLAAFDFPGVPQQCVDHWIGHGTRELLVQALAYSGRTSVQAVRASSVLDAVAGVFDGHYLGRCGTRSHLYPHVREVLQQLRGQGVQLALVTNKDGRYTELLLAAHGLAPLLACVVGGDAVARKKPAPEGVLLCLRHCAVPAERSLFVGDSATDVATARAAGIRVWAVPYGYNHGRPVEEAQPDRVIADLRALLATPGV